MLVVSPREWTTTELVTMRLQLNVVYRCVKNLVKQDLASFPQGVIYNLYESAFSPSAMPDAFL